MLENRKNVRKKLKNILVTLIAIMLMCGAFIKWWPEVYAAIELGNGTINPIYRPKWTKVESTLDKTNKTMSVVVKGSAYESQTINSDVSINYASDVTSTLEAKDITVYINGVEVTVPTNPKVQVGEGSTTTNATSNKTEVTHTITLSNLEEAARQAGLNYTEWSGNISLKIGGRGEDESTYNENVLTDDYGNQNMAETDHAQADGSWIDITFGDAPTDHNTDGIMFADFVKPEFTYVYAGSSRDENPPANPDINYENKTFKMVFSTVDKYFYVPTAEEIAAGQTNKLTLNDLEIKIDGETPQWKDEVGTEDEYGNKGVVKELTSEAITEERAKGDGTTETVTIGYKYTLILSELQQRAIKYLHGGRYLDYSGVVTVTIPEGKIKDKSGNTNNGQTITSGIDHPGNIPTTSHTNPYLPDGFSYVEGDLNTGLVIADGAGNEFVWVEVPKTTDVYSATTLALKLDELEGTDLTNAYNAIENDLHAYTMDYRSNKDGNGNDITYSDEYPDDATVKSLTGIETVDEYNALKNRMLKSIFLNGGFYVGRYETGTQNARTSEGNIESYTPVIKQNVYPYNFVTSSEAQTLSQKFAANLEGYESSLMLGVQWDLILKYMETKGAEQYDLKEESSNWGNSKNSVFNITNTDAKYNEFEISDQWIVGAYGQKNNGTAVYLSTGASDIFSKQNIYDLAGNLEEMTLEHFGGVGLGMIRRSAHAKWSSWAGAPENRYWYGGIASAQQTFRVALFKDGAAEPNEGQVVDLVKPIWYESSVIVDKRKQIVSLDIMVTDKYLKESTLKNEDIQVYVDGVDVSTLANVNSKLSNPTPLTEVRNGQVVQYGAKYRLTITDWQEALRQSGKQYREWSGPTNIVVKAGAAVDYYENESDAPSFNIGQVDVIRPEYTYKYSSTSINKTAKTVTIQFSVTDKYFDQTKTDEQNLKAEDLTILIDGVQPTWKTNEASTDPGVIRTLTKEPIEEERTKADGTKETVKIGYKYTLTLKELEQDAIASGKKYLDYSGVVSVGIPGGKVIDTSDNTNIAQTITLGIDFEGNQRTDVELPNTDYTKPYLPDGYTQVEGTDLSSGLVIEDYLGNQFVWVEVPRTTAVYNSAGLNVTEFTDTDYQNIENDLRSYASAFGGWWDEYPNDETVKAAVGIGTVSEYTQLKRKMLKSVYLNGGFYVGRYETGIDYDEGYRYSSDVNEIIETTQQPVIKKNAYPYNFVTASQSQVLAESFTESIEGYTSSLLFGVQRSLILKYFETKGTKQEDLNNDSTSWGNYRNNLWEKDNTSSKYSSDGKTWISDLYKKNEEKSFLLTTGANDTFSKQGIYDWAGGLWEISLAYADSVVYPVDIYGGGFAESGANTTATSSWRVGTGPHGWTTGFRTALYKDEGIGPVSAEEQPTYIPSGYSHVVGTTMDNGYVIQDMKGNQFVWVEVPKTLEVYNNTGLGKTEFDSTVYGNIEKDLRNYASTYGGSNDEYPSDEIVKAATGIETVSDYTELKHKMLKSIYLNGGFYIGRYETGIDYKDAYRKNSDLNKETTQQPIIKKNAYPYTYVTASQAQKLSESFGNELEGYTSSLLFGVQWNLTLKYLQSKGTEPEKMNHDSTSWGNYLNNLWDTTNNTDSKYSTDSGETWISGAYTKTKEEKVFLTTGASETFAKQGIYDLAGNVFEFTLEWWKDNPSGNGIIFRSGGGDWSGAAAPANLAWTTDATGQSAGFGFRTALYRDTGVADGDAGNTITNGVIADVVDPFWEVQDIDIDEQNQKVTMDLIVTDKYFDANGITLTNANVAEKIKVYAKNEAEGTELTQVQKQISAGTPLKETRIVDGVSTEVQYGTKYTLTLSNFVQPTRENGKLYREYSGPTSIVIAKDLVTDQHDNKSKKQEFDLGHIDIIKPEFTYIYAGTSRDEVPEGATPNANPEIDYDGKKLTVKFSVADKFFYNPTAEELAANENANKLKLDDLTILIDGTEPTWKAADAASTVPGVKRTLTSEEIKDGEVTIGTQYTLVLEDLQQNPNDGFDFSGVVSIGIAAGKIKDTEGNTNLAQTITVGIDETEGEVLPSTVYTTPYLPEGYHYVDGDLNTGLVIADSLNNEYVWVEVPTKIYSNPSYNTENTTADRKPKTSEDYANIEYCLNKYTNTYKNRSN